MIKAKRLITTSILFLGLIGLFPVFGFTQTGRPVTPGGVTVPNDSDLKKFLEKNPVAIAPMNVNHIDGHETGIEIKGYQYNDDSNKRKNHTFYAVYEIDDGEQKLAYWLVVERAPNEYKKAKAKKYNLDGTPR